MGFCRMVLTFGALLSIIDDERLAFGVLLNSSSTSGLQLAGIEPRGFIPDKCPSYCPLLLWTEATIFF